MCCPPPSATYCHPDICPSELVPSTMTPHSVVPPSPLLSIDFLQNLSVCITILHAKQKSPKCSYLHRTVNSVTFFCLIFFLRFNGFLGSTLILILMNSLHILELFLASYEINSPKKLPSCCPLSQT